MQENINKVSQYVLNASRNSFTKKIKVKLVVVSYLSFLSSLFVGFEEEIMESSIFCVILGCMSLYTVSYVSLKYPDSTDSESFIQWPNFCCMMKKRYLLSNPRRVLMLT